MSFIRTRHVIDTAGADAVIAAAEAAADARAARVYICVVDPSGEVVAMRRTDGAQVASARVAIDKARTAAIFVRPSREMEAQVTGGRIGRASAWAGQLLHVKPLLTIKREVVPLKRVRGNKKAMQEFVSQFTSETVDSPTLKVGIAHADAPERAEQLKKMVHGERSQAEVELVTTLGAVVGTHAGPGTVGFFWFDDGE